MKEFFDSSLPEVKLVGAIQDPYDLAIATARTCYSGKGIITPEEVSRDEKNRELRDKIAQSTREAGHLTTRQHAHFVFSLDRVSRSFIWSFLHSHPFYNSEQVSQRYVKVKKGNFIIPKLPPFEKELFEKILTLQMQTYERLIELLLPAVAVEYYKIFPSRRRDERWLKVIQKKTYEIARYILPIATQAYLYHTVSSLTLLRYYKMMQTGDTPSEQRTVIGRMVEEVLKLDPDFKKELSVPLEASKEELNTKKAKQFTHIFDQGLGEKSSKLLDFSPSSEKTLAQAVRTVLGKTSFELSDAEAIDRVLNSAYNPVLGEPLNVSTLSKISRALVHVHFTFQKKLSHTADSQDQRHRMTPASRPFLIHHYGGEPDIVYPKLLKEVSEAKKLFDEVTEQVVDAVNQLLSRGVSFEKAHYLLPNSWAIRFEESGDLLNWYHKWKLRTCYDAQEEIFYASVAEASQVARLFPEIGRLIAAPCTVRKQAGLRPYCPEGDRFCGVAVWNLPIDHYRRTI